MEAKRSVVVPLRLVEVGAVLGALVTAFWGIVYVLGDPSLLLLPAAAGALIGAVLGPAAKLLLMPHVPLEVAVWGTASGTIIGAFVCVIFGPLGSVYGGLGGFAVAAVLLGVGTPRRGRPLAGPADPAA